MVSETGLISGLCKKNCVEGSRLLCREIAKGDVSSLLISFFDNNGL